MPLGFEREDLTGFIIAAFSKMDFVKAEYSRVSGLGVTGQFWYACCCFVGIGALYFTLVWLKWCIKLRAFSGPLSIPFIGNCYQAEALFLMKYLSKLRKRFGKQFTFFAFAKPYLVVCDPAIVRRVLSDTKTFYKGLDYTDQFSVAFGEGLVTSNGDRHRKDRGHFGKYFTKMNIASYMEMVNRKTNETIDQLLLDKDCKSCQPLWRAKKGEGDDGVASSSSESPSGPNGKVYNIEHFFAILALRVFMLFGIGHEFKDLEKEEWLAKQVSDGSWAVGRMITLGLPMWNIFPSVGTIREGRAKLWGELKKLVDKRKAEMRSPEGYSGQDDCLTAMINEDMDEQSMNDHLVTLLSAGHDTTAYFSAYMCYLLAQHQDAQERLRVEIANVMRGRREVTCDDVTEMKFLMNVMQETLRLYSIIPMVTRTCSSETHIKESGVTIPQGTNLMIPMFLINRDPELWENPSKFNPDRFEGSTGYFTSSKNGFFPFGYGSRTCIGNTLSQMESACFMIQLLQNFTLHEDIGFRPKIFAGISLTTSNGINIRLKKI